jgi:hypothetical protein
MTIPKSIEGKIEQGADEAVQEACLERDYLDKGSNRIIYHTGYIEGARFGYKLSTERPPIEQLLEMDDLLYRFAEALGQAKRCISDEGFYIPEKEHSLSVWFESVMKMHRDFRIKTITGHYEEFKK